MMSFKEDKVKLQQMLPIHCIWRIALSFVFLLWILLPSEFAFTAYMIQKCQARSDVEHVISLFGRKACFHFKIIVGFVSGDVDLIPLCTVLLKLWSHSNPLLSYNFPAQMPLTRASRGTTLVNDIFGNLYLWEPPHLQRIFSGKMVNQ